ncbi:ABC transporter ATP-binding protein [Pseudovibrio sp. SPO723]|uniref:ABC transporter ATP-binding protein n=1 Tax=Nesiotobacter zosterae TaxID=392721 RepID=UPI0029C540B4|nr:ABC transporter ATP-binding protein [Pseudovibrio sp. SPO723]MDX5591993.1 ABC transporter ATP-binding protein [Pseudovibrio sp. SPO723]
MTLQDTGSTSVELANLTKSWGGLNAVNDISLSIPSGSFTVLLGPSGCGKSTTLRLIAGLEQATSGKIIIGGKDVTHASPAQRDLAMVFQNYALFPHLSVAENILFGLKVRRVSRADRDERLKRAAEILGISALLERKPSQLSGGQQQRVALGRAIVSQKPICLMDEPLSNLDAKLRHEMRVEIRALQQKLGLTMVYVTHDQTEAITMADQVVLLNNGEVEQAASPHELYTYPGSVFTARFIGTPPMNIAELHGLRDAELSGPDLFPEAPEDALLGIRPEDIELSDEAGVAARVEATEYLGADTLATFKVGSAQLVARVPGRKAVKTGDTMKLTWDAAKSLTFNRTTGKRRDVIKPEELQLNPA